MEADAGHSGCRTERMLVDAVPAKGKKEKMIDGCGTGWSKEKAGSSRYWRR